MKGAGSFNFYSAQYSRFGSPLAAEVRREAYGEDLGQQGWRSLGEQGEIIELVQDSPQGKLLDVACGSGGPSIAIAAATGCRLTGVDIEDAAIEHAKALAGGRASARRCNVCRRRLQPATAVRQRRIRRHLLH